MTFTDRISVRLGADLLKRLDAYRARTAKATGLRVTLADAARQLIAQALDHQRSK